MAEAQEHKQVVDYIKLQYPKVIFNTDMSGIKLTIGQAKKAAQLRSKHKFPDLVIYHSNSLYHGLFIELKKTGEKIYKKDGNFKTEHLKDQVNTLIALHDNGYCAQLARGFNHAKAIIDDYMNIPKLKR